MRVKTLYVRFYKSFNYDYLRKSDVAAEGDPWDHVKSDLLGAGAAHGASAELFYPFVRIPLERDVTTVVGANEAGKSQLLQALRCLLTGEGIERKDFCRYSRFFAVDKAMSTPEFGGEFTELSSVQADTARALLKIPDGETLDSFHFFRRNDGLVLYASANGTAYNVAIKPPDVAKLSLPVPFSIDANVPLPNSVPIEYLCVSRKKQGRTWTRTRFLDWMQAALGHADAFADKASVTSKAAQIASDLALPTVPEDERKAFEGQLELAEELLVSVARIDRSAFDELRGAVKSSEGYANGLVDKMNRQLADSLNFPKWWSQDSEFALYLTLRDFDLVFTVRDRTGSDYSFAERSGGVSYFLSYFVQYLSHKSTAGDEMLLMDEPDAYLSTLGQQDLLRIFDAFADPQASDRRPVQVVYVTHSPFLIDKNHSERIRVLEKGNGDEGTRVVNNAGRNHYEPLRSAFGAFVAETTFIGNCNLLLEGQSDQVLLAGLSSYARRVAPAKDVLDLNRLTLVPSGGAEHVPYMAYLARGRDVDRPAVVVLLDSDASGESARRELEKGYRGREIVRPEFVLSLATLKDSFEGVVHVATEIEDLIHPDVAKLAVASFAREVYTDAEAAALVSTLETPAQSETLGLFAAAQEVAAAASPRPDDPLRLDKVGFARAVLAALTDPSIGAGVAATVRNFQVLFDALNTKARAAVRREESRHLTKQINLRKSSFLRDHASGSSRREANSLLEDLEDLVAHDFSPEGDAVRDGCGRIRQQFGLRDDPGNPVVDWDGLRIAFEDLAYAGVRMVQVQGLGAPTAASVDDSTESGRRSAGDSGLIP